MFPTSNSPDLYALRSENITHARLPGITANSNKNHGRYNLQAFANIYGKFLEILDFRKIDNPNLYRPACLLITPCFALPWPSVMTPCCTMPSWSSVNRHSMEKRPTIGQKLSGTIHVVRQSDCRPMR